MRQVEGTSPRSIVCASRRETGSRKCSRIPAVEEILRNIVENNPSTCSRAVAPALSVSHATVLRALHEYGMHPYQLQRVQAMTLIIFSKHPLFPLEPTADYSHSNISYRCLIY